MTEEKKQQEEENIEEKSEKQEETTVSSSAKDTADEKVIVEKEEKIDTESLSVEEEKKEDLFGNDDELPEDVKKKLEKAKQERSKKKFKKKKKKVSGKRIKSGRAYVKATYNNTLVTLTDAEGNVLATVSAGMAGFKTARKATPYAATIVTKIASMKAKEEYGLEEIEVFVKGVGTGRESAIRALNANGFVITSIKDVTPIPHNGCRAKKLRRM